MNEAILIWLYLALSEIVEVFCVVGLLSFFGWGIATIAVGCVSFFGTSENSYDKSEVALYKKFISYKRPVMVAAVVAVLIGSFFPTKEDLKYIIGGSVVWNIADAGAQSEELKALPENVLNAMNHFLEEVQEEE